MTKCKFALLFTLALVASFFTFGVSSAQAFQGDPTSYWNTVDDPITFQDFLDETNGASIATEAETAGAADVWFGAAGLSVMGPIGLVAGGAIAIDATWHSGLGSALGQWLADTGTPYEAGQYINKEQWCPWFGGSDATSPDAPIGTCSTLDGATTGINPSSDPSSPIAPLRALDHLWIMDFGASDYSGTNGCHRAGSPNDVIIGFNPDFATGLSTAVIDCMTDFMVAQNAVFNSVPVERVIYENSDITTTETCKNYVIDFWGATDYTGQCFEIVATQQEMLNMLGPMTWEPCDGPSESACTDLNPLGTHIMGGTSGYGSGGTPTPSPKVEDHIDHHSPDSDSEGPVNCYVTAPNPTCPQAPTTITIPQPQITETYPQYVARLRALGFLGHIYEVDDDMAYPAGSPAALLSAQQITEVEVGTTKTYQLYWMVPGHGLPGSATTPDTTKEGHPYKWPNPGPNAPPDTPITIQKVPDGYGGGVPGGGNGNCDCPNLNISPLQSIQYGSKFPFGAFSMLLGVANHFGGSSGSAVDFSIMGHDVSLASSDWTGTYRPIVFAILEFLGTLLVIVFALRLIRHPGGDSE